MTRLVKICADDFGFNDFVSQGIIHLISQRRLSATSCMTNMPNWNNHFSELLKFRDRVEIGLHFNLTEGNLRSKQFSLNRLILESYLGKINILDIETEFQLQLDNFKNCSGFLPDYIDGHQHIQQLPVIRNAVVNVIKRNYDNILPYIRVSSNGLNNSLKISTKALLVHLLGANSLRNLARKNDIPTTSNFAGFSSFKDDQYYPLQFEYYLKSIKNNGVIMCHPGLANPNNSDPIAASRFKEYNFFNSNLFLELLQKHQVILFENHR